MQRHYHSYSDLPGALPLFPLAGVVLLPRGHLPLNIFEPRYLEMVDHALKGERLVGMIQPTESEDTVLSPRLSQVGCAGKLISFQETGDNRYLISYWGGHFLPLPPRSPGDFAWLLDHFFAPFAYPGGMGGTEIRAGGIAAAFFLIGIRALWKDRWPVALAIVLPGVFALLASGLHKYPFAGRLLLFLVPLMILSTARGAAMLGSALVKSQPVAAVVLLGVLLAAPCLETYQQLNMPMRSEQIQPVLTQVRERWQSGDRMYVYYGSLPAFEYYTRESAFPTEAVVKGTEARSNTDEYRQQLAAFQGRSRVWIVFSHRHADEEPIIRSQAEGLGRCEETIRGNGAAAYRFNFTRTGE